MALIDGEYSDNLRSPKSGGTFGHSFREPKYKIEFHPEDSPFHPLVPCNRNYEPLAIIIARIKYLRDQIRRRIMQHYGLNRKRYLHFKDDDQESLVMPHKSGESFLCFLPKVEKAKSAKAVPQLNTSSMIVESEKRIKLKTPDELLEQEGWWSYEFCYQKKLRQFHLEDDKVVQEFVLGEYDEETTAAFNQNISEISTLEDPRSKDASQRYHAHQYTNGTVCDLTNQPRETEVRFVCSESRAMINSITELSTCKYALTVQCPTLCKHPLFQEERPVWHIINCNVLPKDYKESKVEEESKENEIAMVTENEGPSNHDPDE
ncbi:Protein OS-9 [Morella rubra]|uniref:Protein OS-9 homolog n=1 Tax=Morella rubra TaxID=262757 RepID=A0A6A1VAN9_9ROSI|nr:Protein OS-9 [Morella rubra]